MADNELLLAISDIMDKKLDARIKPLENEISLLRQDMGREIGILRQEMESEIGSVRGEIGSLRQDMEAETGSLRQQIHLLKLQNENEIIPRLQNIEECYLSTFNRYKNSVEGYEAMQADIELLKEVSREHSEKLQMIS